MEKQGLLTLNKYLERRNLIRISLTERGEEAYHKAEQLRKRLIDNEIMGCLSAEEQAVLWR
jgi:DNA-binding MarR family transcriptional regulator